MKKKTSSNSIRCSFLALVVACSNYHVTFGFVRHDIVVPSRNRLQQLAATTSNNNKKSYWSVADDWNSLSSENPLNSGPDSSDLFNQDLASLAANEMEQTMTPPSPPKEEDLWIEGAVETIQNAYNLPTESEFMNIPLYDTSITPSTKELTYEDEMGTQIAMLVRCNENPEEMNIEQGRAVRELTIEQKNDVSQLITLVEKEEEEKDGETTTTVVEVQPTPFFLESIRTIFQRHAAKKQQPKESNNDNDNDDTSAGYYYYMDSQSVAKWMQQCLGPGTPTIGKHDKRVQKTISKYGTYGTGIMTEEDFINLYIQTIVGKQKKEQVVVSGSSSNLEATLKTLMYRQTYINAVWRDIRNHGMISPKEQERQQQLETIMQQQQQPKADNQNNALLMDECEIMEWDEESSSSNFNRKSSHLHVELAADNETPIWLRDGEFVFIDEESCIGCKQCASVAPSSFLMLENSGRARTFEQRHGVDVAMAVDACPVNCMHFVSFQELKKFELARDQGDGRDDHKHFGKEQHTHTPLYVSGMDSDANHKSSWHHYLRNKCYVSGQCPKAGCYDCPYYGSPGKNPHFQKKLKKAEHIRAEHFKKTGAADLWRKTADL